MPMESILILVRRIGLVVGSLLNVLSLIKFGSGPNLAHAGIFSCLMVLLAGIDRDDLMLPERSTLPGLFVCLALGGLLSWLFRDCGLL